MIIVRTPLRISLFGGGTDIPSFYSKMGGMVVSAAIDKYIYLTAHPMFETDEILLKYSSTERVKQARDIQHNIFRILLENYEIKGVDIGVSSDIPSGTGLGSSSSFTVGLSNLLRTYLNLSANKETLAKEACDVEIRSMQQLIGKQDQYAAAYGGLNRIEFLKDDTVEVNPIKISDNDIQQLNDSLHIVRVGKTRSAGKMLQKQATAQKLDKKTESALTKLLDLTVSINDSVFTNFTLLGEKLNLSWELKKESNPYATTDEIDDVIKLGLSKGALGAKLLGAGGAGFVLFLVPKDFRHEFLMSFASRKVLNVRIDFEGSKLIYDSK